MTLRRLAILVLVCGVFSLNTPAASRFMSVDEVQPGMVGVGRTVFQGNAIEDFNVRIIGVLRSTIGPRRDLILARLDGGPLAKTGVIAGMSGSPVYVDGRLLGAVSYSLGSFATEAIAGITPIAEMIEATTVAPGAQETRSASATPPPATPAALVMALSRALNPTRPFAASTAEVSILHASSAFDLQSATMLRPIATPLAIGGFTADGIAPVLAAFEQAGFVAVPSGAGAMRMQAPATSATPPLRPGDPVGVALITGDLYFGATGTVTDVDGDRVYAFGHPFYNLGPTRFPMTRAFVHAVLPSLLSSVKLTSVGDIIGTVQQDRATAIAGTLGKGPDTVTMSLALEREHRERRVFRFQVCVDPLLTPLLVYTALASVFSSHEHDFGASTFTVKGRAQVRNQPPVEFDDVFAGDQPAISAAASVAMPLGALLTNDREPIDIDSVNLTIQAAERPRVMSVERIWIDATDIRRGRSVPLKILLRTWRGDNELHTIPLEIPLNAEGTLTVLVADGARFAQWEQRAGKPSGAPDSVPHLIARLNNTRRGNRLYVRLIAQDVGAVVGDETMPALPSSVLAVLGGSRAGSGDAPMQNAIVGAWEIPVGQAVTGVRTLTLSVLDGSSRRP